MLEKGECNMKKVLLIILAVLLMGIVLFSGACMLGFLFLSVLLHDPTGAIAVILSLIVFIVSASAFQNLVDKIMFL
jgi:hypothetical protein